MGIGETLKEFRTILLGQVMQVYTDHINLTFKNVRTPHILCWRLLIEEFGPNLTYVKGQNNIPADALSCLDREDQEQNDITHQEFCRCLTTIRRMESAPPRVQPTPANLAHNFGMDECDI